MEPGSMIRCSLGRSCFAKFCGGQEYAATEVKLRRLTDGRVACITNLLAHELVHPLCLFVVSAGVDAWDHERHAVCWGWVKSPDIFSFRKMFSRLQHQR